MKLLWFLFFCSWNCVCYYFHDLYIASCFFFIPSRQLYVQNRWWVCGLRCDLGMMCGLRCVCCWQWRYHNNVSWSHSGVFVVGFEQVNGGWVSNVFEDCCIYICLFNKKYKNCKWKEKKISNRNHSENLIKVKLK